MQLNVTKLLRIRGVEKISKIFGSENLEYSVFSLKISLKPNIINVKNHAKFKNKILPAKRQKITLRVQSQNFLKIKNFLRVQARHFLLYIVVFRVK